MQKINFQNLPSTTTPINATNLNAIQTNVENVFNGSEVAGDMVVDSIRTKNLLSKGNIRFGIYNVGQGAYVYGNNACCTANRIEIDNTKDYVLSTGNTQTTSSFYVMYYNASGTYLGNISATFSSGSIRLGSYSNYSSAKYVNFRFDIEPNNLINPMFEEGATKTNYVENENLNAIDYYTDAEIQIGRWIDGKPIYRSVITITSPQSTNTNYYNVSNLHIQSLIHLYGYYKSASGNIFDIPFYDSDSNYSVVFLSDAGYIRGRFGSPTNISEVRVIIEYTKTTD